MDGMYKNDGKKEAGSGNRTQATLVGGDCSHHCTISGMDEIKKSKIHVLLIPLFTFMYKCTCYIYIYFQTVGVGQSRSRSHSLDALKRKFSISLEKDDYEPLGEEVKYAYFQHLL